MTLTFGDRYTLDAEIGAGGMPTVHRARDLRHGRPVAIKMLRPDVAQSVGTERFLREIQLAAQLSHPHILPLFDSGEAAGVNGAAALFYVMPLVMGESLRDRLDRERPLPVADAVRIAAEVADALDYAHRNGIVHRDIKPENILLQDGHAVVADFGIGKALSAAAEASVTQTGISIGTPAYMSPEQAAGEQVDGQSDLYSLGCVLYEALVGEPPFTGPNAQAVIAKRFIQTPADVTALRDGIARPVARALQRALARTPIDRFDTVAEFLAALREPEAATTSRSDTPERSIAVLPFANLTADPENEYFADGITEEILTALSQVNELKEGYAMLGYYSMVAPAEARAKAIPAAENAVRFAPDIAESHAALGIASLLFEWEDRSRTTAAFRRAMELGPTSSQSAIWYWHFYLAWASSRESEGLAGMLALQARDPLSAFVCGMIAILEASLGHATAMDWASRALALDPDAFLSRFALQVAVGATGNWASTLEASESLFALGGRVGPPLTWYGIARHRLGDVAGAQAVYDELVVLSGHGERGAYYLACLAAELGRDAEATAWLRRATAQRDPAMFAYGRARLLPVEVLKRLPEHDECMRVVNWPTDPYVHVFR